MAEIERVLESSIESMGDDELSKEAKRGLNSQLIATKTAMASREIAASDGPGLKKKEWVIYNAKTDTETIIVESKYKSQVEHLLMGCYTYLGMEKSAQKEYVKFGNLKKAVTLLDECY